MPLHDWSKIPSGLFHHFHQDWSTVPLESTYQAAWDASPEAYRQAVETGVMPNPGPD
jgi:hypothetical protein